MTGRREMEESEEREKGRRETFRSVDLMNLKLRRRLFVGLLFYAACTQGHQTQRNKIPRYVCAANGRRTYGYEFNVYSPSCACVWHHIKALLPFFLSLYRTFFHRKLPPALWHHQLFVKSMHYFYYFPIPSRPCANIKLISTALS